MIRQIRRRTSTRKIVGQQKLQHENHSQKDSKSHGYAANLPKMKIATGHNLWSKHTDFMPEFSPLSSRKPSTKNVRTCIDKCPWNPFSRNSKVTHKYSAEKRVHQAKGKPLKPTLQRLVSRWSALFSDVQHAQKVYKWRYHQKEGCTVCV